MSAFEQTDALAAVLRVGVVLDELEVHVIAALREEHVDAFVVGLGADFYVDADMIRDAIRHRSKFNVI